VLAIRGFILFSLLLASAARAELQIEINQGVENPTPIAVVPFAWQGVGSPPEDVAQIADSDLARSGQFSPVGRRDMLSYPTRESELFFRDWRAISAEYVLIGRVSVGSQARIDFQLFDTTRQEAVADGTVTGPVAELRMLAHRVSDSVYETLTGIRGAFATRLLYVSVTRNPDGKDFYRLTLADADGRRPIVLLEGRDPIWRRRGRPMVARWPMRPLRPHVPLFTGKICAPVSVSS